MEGFISDRGRLDSIDGRFRRRRRRCVRVDLATPRPHRLGNVLQDLRSHVIENDIDLAAYLPLRVVGDANASGFRDPFEPRGDVDAIAKYVVVVENDVADVNANPEFDPFVLRHGGIPFGHAALDFNSTAHRIHGAGKLDQHAVAGGLHDPAAVGGDRGVDEGLSDRFEPSQRAFLIGSHEPAVPGDIRRQHRCQSSFHVLAGQGMSLRL